MKLDKLKAMCVISNNISSEAIVWGLIELGVDVRYSNTIIDLTYINENQVENLCSELNNIDFVISYNFSVNAAEACHLHGTPYISWIYDSPQGALYSKHALYPENYIFVFDSCQFKRLQELKIPHLFFQPLGANLGLISTISLAKGASQRYRNDISFVGQLYRNSSFDEYISVVSEDEKKYVLSIIQEKCFQWTKDNTIFNSINKKYTQSLQKYLNDDLRTYAMSPQYLEETLLLGPSVTQIERKKILSLASNIADTHLYTKLEDMESAKRLINPNNVHPPISTTEMYKVFYSSKVNLNITLRTIEAGAPQRIFDIMGVGGLVLSNYQSDLDDLFMEGKEIVLFKSLEEFIDKLHFLISNDDYRIRIAERGYKRVINDYSCVKSLKRMINEL